MIYTPTFNPLTGGMQLYPNAATLTSIVEDQLTMTEVWDYGLITTTTVPGTDGAKVVIDCVKPNTIYRYSRSVADVTIQKVAVGGARSRVYIPMSGREYNRLQVPHGIRWLCDTIYIQYGFYLEFFYNFVKPVQYERISGDH